MKINEITLVVSYSSELLNISNKIFKINKKNGKKLNLYSFKNEFLSSVEYTNMLTDVDQELLDTLQLHIAKILTTNRKNNQILIGIYPMSNIITDIEEMPIKIKEKNKIPANLLYQTTDNDNALVILKSIYNANDKYDFYVGSLNNDKFYHVNTRSLHGGEILEISETQRRLKLNEYQIITLIGDIKFIFDDNFISSENKRILKSITVDINNYLNIWNDYNDIELEQRFDEFKKTGAFRFSDANFMYNGESFKLGFSSNDFSKICRHTNEILTIGDQTVIELLGSSNIEKYKEKEKSLLANGSITTGYFTKSGVNEAERTIEFKIKSVPNIEALKSGYVSLSLLGDTISYNRRKNARDKIISGKALMPNLFTWFSENPKPNNINEHYEIDRTILEKNNLTLNQLEAINIILNTPDIAIVQGPPGTGKTTIISESLTQINNYSKKNNNYANNLLTGFKHDTVLNMTDRVKLYDIPTIKIGSSNKDEERDRLEPEVIKFVNELVEKIDTKYSNLQDNNKDYQEIENIYMNIKNFDCSTETTKNLLDKVKGLSILKYNHEAQVTLSAFISNLNSVEANDYMEDEFLDVLYSIPLNEEAYLDSIQRIEDSLSMVMMDNDLKEDAESMLNLLIKRDKDFEQIKSLRRNLIVKYRKLPNIFTNKADKNQIINFLGQLLEKLRIERLKTSNGKDLAIINYRNSLIENPSLLRDTILEYAMVLGATNQKSISREMLTIKESISSGFDNVYIDEAATTPPLDLFIPMSLSKRRIILVGDHRQLPNIVDEKIIKSIEEKNENSSLDVDKLNEQIKTTLFELLIDKAHELEKIDGIKRVITLNTQFRMNPKLAEIISDYFYKDEGGLFSLRPESDFIHNYHNMVGKYLYWLNVEHNSRATYITSAGSRINIAEAKKIANHIYEALSCSNLTPTSIGVITYYKDQVVEINKALREKGIIDSLGNGVGEFSDQEILVGTVDAFQGREFDVVYLSITYSIDPKTNINPTFSRLVIENLLNVSLSRQRKLLIVCGNASMFNLEKAHRVVPSLTKIKEICEEGGLIE